MAKPGTMIRVNGVMMPEPSTMEWGLQDVSAADSGRTEDALMHKNRVAQKRKIKLGWQHIDHVTASQLIQAFNPEYINVTCFDFLAGQEETRTYYVGDRSAPIKMWLTDRKIVTQLSFDIIER